jgi:hypothetical protein
MVRNLLGQERFDLIPESLGDEIIFADSRLYC